ncbi:gene transfer agent family protein [Mesorhizobium sp. BR1-1-13]|uniref:gene transfer agent family protein n=1 Tax=Mesorhizobium sp. BR1-1-13 TaxID=2876656 RepID=UPI001CD188C1|nr:gene transfer agent family protein [Mesorhizobium sp. BR1-1-13]MBZ9943438.1 gene transfer agent family protein [Mesorhizobium sp. BR1-1-13]
MARDARVEMDWADGTYAFRLAWGQLSELQEKCDAGPYVVLGRLQTGQWRVEDVSNVIRLGLIGGGLEPIKALKLVRTYVEDRPPMESVLYAHGILSAALHGAPEEGVGETSGEASKNLTTSPMENSALD